MPIPLKKLKPCCLGILKKIRILPDRGSTRFIERLQQMHKKDGTLLFQVLPTGDIDGYFAYYVDGKEKRKKIGRYGRAKGLMSLKEIRIAYLELSALNKKGTDVKVEETRQRQEAARIQREEAEKERQRQLQGSFQQLVDAYLEHAQANLSKHYVTAVKSAFNNLKDFDMTIKANAVNRADIIAILHPIRERGSLIMANRMRSYLQSLFKFGIEFDEDNEGVVKDCVLFFLENNPVNAVPKAVKKEDPGERYLEVQEVTTFWKALESSQMDSGRVAVLKLMLATGARLEALSGLQWVEINWNEAYLTVPPERSKNGKAWVIPLGKIAFEALRSVPKTHGTFVFPAGNGKESLRLDGFSQALSRLCQQTNMEPFTPRDLRRTFKSLAGKAGLSKEIRDRLQNHAFSDVSSRHYDKYDYLHEKRHAMSVWDAYLQGLIGVAAPVDNVTPLRRKSA